MFTRVKQSRNGDYLQIVGNYDSIDHALQLMARELPRARRRATVAERKPYWQSIGRARALREEADRLAAKLEELKHFAHEHPDLVERDRARAKRHSQRRRAAATMRMEQMARRREDAGR